jgi:hypothetical protein
MNRSAHDPSSYYYAEPRLAADAESTHAVEGHKFADLAIRHLFLLTAGAAIVLLAFAGNALNGQAPPARLDGMASAIGWCGFAAAAAVLVSAFAYLAQVLMREFEGEAAYWTFLALRVLAVIVWFCSLIMFLIGIQAAASALTVRVAPPEQQRSWAPIIDSGKPVADAIRETESVPEKPRPSPKSAASAAR